MKAVVILLRILLIILFVGSCAWAYKEPGFEPVLAALGAFATLIGDWLSAQSNDHTGKVTMNLHAGNNSKNQQAGRDIINKY